MLMNVQRGRKLKSKSIKTDRSDVCFPSISLSEFHILRSGLYIYAAVCSQSSPFTDINICAPLYVHMNMIHSIMNHNAIKEVSVRAGSEELERVRNVGVDE